MLSNKLIDELGLLPLVLKNHSQKTEMVTTKKNVQRKEHELKATENIAISNTHQHSENIDKNEFRLLVKMLQAINHDCSYDLIEYNGTTVKYHLPSITLVFHDINTPDDKNTINLSSLRSLLADPSLKRPVWEKLKKLKS